MAQAKPARTGKIPAVAANSDPAPGPARVEAGSGQAQAAWPADRTERRPIEGLIAYARNARLHSAAQVGEIAASIEQWGWTMPVLVDEAGEIIAGHGRVLAAQQLGLPTVPTMVARGWTEEQVRAYRIADNKLSLNSSWDGALLALELGDLKSAGFDLGLTGFGTKELARIFPEGAADPGGINYSEQFGVIVMCKDAAHQERTYNELIEAGHECRVVVT